MIPLPSHTPPLVCCTMSIFTPYKKILAVSTAAAAILALPAQAAPALPDVLPKDPPPLLQDLTLTEIYHTSDNSYVLHRFDAVGAIMAAGSTMLGWASHQYVVSLRLDNGEYRGLGISQHEIVGGINVAPLETAVRQLELPRHLLTRIVQAHERQHMKDYQKYPFINFSLYEYCKCPPASRNSSGGDQGGPFADEIAKLKLPVNDDGAVISMEELYKKNTDLLEGRAVQEEYKAFKHEILNAIKVLHDYEKCVAKLAELKAKEERKPDSGQVKKDIAATQARIDNLKPTYDELNKYGLDHFMQMSPNAKIKKSKGDEPDYANLAEKFFMEKIIGDTVIASTGTKYRDAYIRYTGLMHKDRIMNEQNEGMKALVAQCLMKHPTQKGITMEYEIEGRPVCLPCAAQDTMGSRCKWPWCANYGNWPSEYAKQQGDYIPASYEDPFKEKVVKKSK